MEAAYVRQSIHLLRNPLTYSAKLTDTTYLLSKFINTYSYLHVEYRRGSQTRFVWGLKGFVLRILPANAFAIW